MNAPSTTETSALATVEAPRLLGGRDLILQADNLNAMIRVSELMANSGQAVPRHLRKNPGACFAVTSQAMRWNMDPFALGQQSYTTDDTAPLAYMGQAIIAALNNSPLLAQRLQFTWGGPWEKIVGRFVWKESSEVNEKTKKPKKYLAKAWDDSDEAGLWCTVTARLVGETEPRVLQLFLMQARVRNSPLWVEDPRQQLAYLAARRWGRLYAPDVIMGVYTPDELAEPGERFMGPVDEVQPAPKPDSSTTAGADPKPNTGTGELPEWPDESFKKKEAKFQEHLAKGKTVDDLVAFYGKQGRFTEAQMRRLHALAAEKTAAGPAVIDNPAEKKQDGQPNLTYAHVAERLNAAKNLDELTLAADLIRQVADEQQRKELGAIFDRLGAELPASA